tara:strand:- start:5348 stop:6043 length:696 start_codon:yes stop_codon:yes gene_type:complete
MPDKISNGALEGLKYLALLFMIGDHVNKYLFNATLPGLFELGRLAMPLFGIVMAYNLARPGIADPHIKRLLIRLAVFGAVSTPFFIALGGIKFGWWPLNILFTLLIAAVVVRLLDSGRPVYVVLAVAIFLLAGSAVEFQWYGLAVVVTAWLYFDRATPWTLTLLILSCASLWFINGNFYALAALPLVYVATHINIDLPRQKWLFYGFYPVHLFALWLIRIPMAKAGYLFFM